MKPISTCIFILVYYFSHSQFGSPNWERLTIANGLPSNECYRVIEIEEGEIWFATDNGIAVYDGYEIVVYDQEEGLTDNSVLYFYRERETKRVWCITMNSRICYYEDGHFHPYKHNDIIKEQIKSTVITDFAIENGTIYIGTPNKGILIIEPNGSFKYLDTRIQHYRNILQLKDEGVLYSGLSSTKHDNILVKTLKGDSLIANYSSTPFPHMQSRQCEIPGGHAVTTANAIIVIQNGKSNVLTLNKNQKPIYIDYVANSLWVGFHNGGLQQVNIDKDPYLTNNHLLATESVSSFYKDKFNSFWVTTLDGGVYFTNSLDLKNVQFADLVNNQSVSSILKNKDHLYLGLSSGQVIKYNTTTGESYLVITEKGLEVAAMYMDFSDNYILVDANQFSKIDLNTNQISRLGETYNSSTFDVITKGPDNAVYVGNYTGLSKIDREKLKSISIEDKIKEYRVTDAVIHKDMLYVCTSFGLGTLDKDKIRLLDLPDDLTKIASFDGFLVASSRSGSLYLIKNNKVVSKFGGFRDERIVKFRVAQGKLWVGTNDKIFVSVGNISELDFNRIDLGANELFDVRDFIVDKNAIYIASNNGVNILKLGTSRNSKHPYKVLFTSAFNQNVSIGTNRSFPWYQNSIEVNFKTNSYAVNQSVLYRYKLIGRDENWITTSDPKVSLQGLKPGAYRLIVSVQSPTGDWSRSEEIFSFTIRHPFYQTSLFYGIVTVLLLSLVYFVFRIRILSFNKEVFTKLMRSLINKMNRKNEITISLKSIANGVLYNVKTSEIVYIQSSRNYCDVHLKDRKLTIRSSLKDIQSRLIKLDPSFIRIHKSTIINSNHVGGVGHKKVVMSDETTLAIGRQYKECMKFFKS